MIWKRKPKTPPPPAASDHQFSAATFAELRFSIRISMAVRIFGTATTAARILGESRAPFSPPELRLVGNATDVVLGPPGGGFDGPYGMTEPEFEFEADEF